MSRIGVVDIGTVSVRMGIADVRDGAVVTLAKKTRVCDLGQGLDETGVLDAKAIDLTRSTADEYGRCFTRNRCDHVVCTLTQAAREALNADELLGGLRDLGYEPLVIEGEVEGALTALGASIPAVGPCPVVIDSGGGSTEISRWLDDGTLWIRSTPVGCRRVTERFLELTDPPSLEAIARARGWIRGAFEDAIDWEPGDVSESGRMVVTGGASTTLAAIVHEMERYDPALVQGTVLSQREIDAIALRLGRLTVRERGDVVGIQPKRAPIILAGALIISELMGVLGYAELTVSEADSLQGIALVADAAAEGKGSPVGWTPTLTVPRP